MSQLITTLNKLEEDTARDVRDNFNEYGWNHPRATWKSALRFSRVYGLVAPALKPINASAAKILTACRKRFLRGQSNAKKRSVRA
jgi:hypothetical protein